MPRANSRRFELGAVGAPIFYALVDHADTKIAPRTIRIKSSLLVPGEPDEAQASLAQGLISSVWWSDPPWHQGFDRLGCMRLRFGSVEGIFRDVYADLREGEYNLPPCQTISVHAAYWRSYPAQASHELEVSAEIATGESVESTPLTFTATMDADMGETTPDHPSNTRYCPAPPGAYAFEALAGGGTGIIATGDTNGFAPPALYVERDPGEGRWLPPSTPILLGAARGVTCRPIRTPDSGTYWGPQITYFVR
jgi:hypothetical protein